MTSGAIKTALDALTDTVNSLTRSSSVTVSGLGSFYRKGNVVTFRTSETFVGTEIPKWETTTLGNIPAGYRPVMGTSRVLAQNRVLIPGLLLEAAESYIRISNSSDTSQTIAGGNEVRVQNLIYVTNDSWPS